MFLLLVRLVGSLFWLWSSILYLQKNNDTYASIAEYTGSSEHADIYMTVGASCFVFTALISLLNRCGGGGRRQNRLLL
jgi:hypothetical protein